MSENEQHYFMKWDNHEKKMFGNFAMWFNNSTLVDCSIIFADGYYIQCHRVSFFILDELFLNYTFQFVLAANSEYFRKLFIDDRMISITVFVPYKDMMSILELMYRGEVRIRQVVYEKNKKIL